MLCFLFPVAFCCLMSRLSTHSTLRHPGIGAAEKKVVLVVGMNADDNLFIASVHETIEFRESAPQTPIADIVFMCHYMRIILDYFMCHIHSARSTMRSATYHSLDNLSQSILFHWSFLNFHPFHYRNRYFIFLLFKIWLVDRGWEIFEDIAWVELVAWSSVQWFVLIAKDQHVCACVDSLNSTEYLSLVWLVSIQCWLATTLCWWTKRK